MRLGKLHIGWDFIFIAALLYYLDDSGVVGWVLISCLLHELGHWAVIRLLGGRIEFLRLSRSGAEMRLSGEKELSPEEMILAALAGPAVNLCLAAAGSFLARQGAGESLYLFAGVNLGLACFNLLPAHWLDGGQILGNILTMAAGAEAGQRGRAAASILTVTGLLLGGLWLLWSSGGRNFTLLIAGLWMLTMLTGR